MKSKKSPAELRAMAFAITDEIETRAQPLIKKGWPRDKAIFHVIKEMAA